MAGEVPPGYRFFSAQKDSRQSGAPPSFHSGHNNWRIFASVPDLDALSKPLRSISTKKEERMIAKKQVHAGMLIISD